MSLPYPYSHCGRIVAILLSQATPSKSKVRWPSEAVEPESSKTGSEAHPTDFLLAVCVAQEAIPRLFLGRASCRKRHRHVSE